MKTPAERNPFFIYTQDGFVTIYLGDKQSLESELILCIDKAWLEPLIAALRMPEKPARFAVSLVNTKTKKSVFAYGDTEKEAYLNAINELKGEEL